jgi:ATP-dependent helicase/DNAse subunit B
MPARSTVLIGPARSGKTDQLLSKYRAALNRRVPGSVLWLAPTARSAASIRERLLSADLTACFSPGVMTFDRFAESILRASPALVKPISDLLRRQLIGHVIDQAVAAGRLRYFGSIADTPGFVDLVGRFIREWKRMEIWPEQFREVCRSQGETAKDRELADLYTEYQQRLIDHHLYDAEGRFWTARSLLRDGQRRPWEHLQLVVADGFTDFTRTQHEILQILGQRVAELVISLPGEPGQRRDDLFAKPRKTLARLHFGLPELTESRVARPSGVAWPAMGHLEQRLFENPRDVRPSDDSTGIEIIAATGQYEELARVGGRVKSLLTSGDPRQADRRVPPGDVMVVFRSLDSTAALVREIFTEQGIPYSLECGRPLDGSPALASLLSFLRLDLEDWPLGRLLALLTNNYFRPHWPQWRQGEAVAAAVSVIRGLYFFSGRRTLFEMLERRLAYLESNNSISDETSSTGDKYSSNSSVNDCRLAIDLLNRLGAALDALPQQATAGLWVKHLRTLATEIGFVSALDDEVPLTPDGFDDRAAWLRLIEALSAPDEVARLTAGEAPKLDRREFVQLVCDTLRNVELPPALNEEGRVRVLSAASARALSVPYLFIAGMSEKSFPPPERENRAYSEAEYRRLAAAGLPLVLREERGHEEMLLFYEVATRATRALTLSYAALDE